MAGDIRVPAECKQARRQRTMGSEAIGDESADLEHSLDVCRAPAYCALASGDRVLNPSHPPIVDISIPSHSTGPSSTSIIFPFTYREVEA